MTAGSSSRIGEAGGAIPSDHDAASPAGNLSSCVTQRLARRLTNQGALLFLGYASAQGFSFMRNALIGHGLSKGDFGIAATITLTLQLMETLGDLGTDRLIVQAVDGDAEPFVANAHAVNLARGALTAALLYFSAGPIAAFFGIPDIAWALEIAALVPLIRGFLHLDCRRAQRRLDNRPQLLIEVLPQAATLAATLPLIMWSGGYAVAVWLALLQATAMVMLSHVLAERPYRLVFDLAVIGRFVRFGWPIWLSAFPLIAVYQGDRIVIARFAGMEDLAAFSAAFMITMVPGLIAAKVGHALMLPVLSGARGVTDVFERRFARLSEVTALATSLYLLLFLAAGGAILPLAFGDNYTGLGPVVAWLAVMWGFRMMQAVPGMALMALGQTRPLLVAGMIRASALILTLAAAIQGLGLASIAACGVLGELASLVYVAWRLDRAQPSLMQVFLIRVAALAPAVVLGVMCAALFTPKLGIVAPVAAAALAGAILTQLTGWVAPELYRSVLDARLGHAQSTRH
ncbi:MAG: hypothetical protein CTY20_04890 [Hyphomicrobium sp.]|nr:hypothetical protein [Rhodospirillum sp.]PPD29911.1 MAG: hypothetical protein CTY20_04890 [Hyphomicrobium sp.]